MHEAVLNYAISFVCMQKMDLPLILNTHNYIRLMNITV